MFQSSKELRFLSHAEFLIAIGARGRVFDCGRSIRVEQALCRLSGGSPRLQRFGFRWEPGFILGEPDFEPNGNKPFLMHRALAPAHFASAKAEIRPSRMVEEIRGLPTLDAGAKARMFMSLSPQADGLLTLVYLSTLTKTYRLSPAAADKDTNRHLVRSLSFSILVLLIVPFAMMTTRQFRGTRELILILVIEAFLIPLIIWRVIRRTRRMLRNAVETYQLTIDDGQIMRTQNECPTVVILRSEVQKISERSGQGFRIETAKRAANIWVPKELEGYEEVRALLLSTTPAEASTTQHPLALTYGYSVLGIMAFFAVMWSHERMLVTGAGLVVLCFFVAYILQVARAWPNLSRQTKRAIWVIVFPTLAVVARIVSVWR